MNKPIRPLLITVILFAPLLAGCSSTPAEEGRIGVFDSRAIAIAWVRSDGFREVLARRTADFEARMKKAEEAGDQHEIKKLEDGMRGLQERIHRQGFSTWPVHDILARYEADVHRVATETGVVAIVSKWELAYQKRGTRFVDVTDQLVKAFEPTADTLKTIESIKDQEPVPLSELKGLGSY